MQTLVFLPSHTCLYYPSPRPQLLRGSQLLRGRQHHVSRDSESPEGTHACWGGCPSVPGSIHNARSSSSHVIKNHARSMWCASTRSRVLAFASTVYTTQSLTKVHVFANVSLLSQSSEFRVYSSLTRQTDQDSPISRSRSLLSRPCACSRISSRAQAPQRKWPAAAAA